MTRAPHPRAFVIGDLELIRPLASAGARCVAVTGSLGAPRWSRLVDATVEYAHPLNHGDVLRDRLLAAAAQESHRPVLYYQEDEDLLFVSRHREELAKVFRFVIAEHDLVEDLVDKARFQRLAERVGLPVPPGGMIEPGPDGGVDVDGQAFPAIVKPVQHDRVWNRQVAFAKAARVDDAAALRTLLGRVRGLSTPLLVQRYLPGTEERIESYHCYVDDEGSVVGEFTGRKIRTNPPAFGYTTALRTSDAADVRELGRHVVSRIGLTGVAKLDFKRDPEGRLWLLEINPRFNLWHHVGAVAGVNLPGLVWADLAGKPRPATSTARPDVTWSQPWSDAKAARDHGLTPTAWLRWTLGADTHCVLSWRDPLPFVRGVLWPEVRGVARTLRSSLRRS